MPCVLNLRQSISSSVATNSEHLCDEEISVSVISALSLARLGTEPCICLHDPSHA